MNAQGEGLHGVQRLHGLSQHKNRRVPPLAHRQILHQLQCRVLQRIGAGESLFDDDDLVVDLIVAEVELFVTLDHVDFVAQLGQGRFDRRRHFRRADAEQGGLIAGANNFEFFHDLFQL